MRGAWAALAATLALTRVGAAETASDGVPVSVELTDATTVIYAWKNRDFAANDQATVLNDKWGVWYNRLHAQVSRGAFRFNARIDNAWFFASPDPTEAALTLVNRRPASSAGLPAPTYFRLKEQQAGLELSNRYIN